MSEQRLTSSSSFVYAFLPEQQGVASLAQISELGADGTSQVIEFDMK
jgi:hypothetical protein